MHHWINLKKNKLIIKTLSLDAEDKQAQISQKDFEEPKMSFFKLKPESSDRTYKFQQLSVKKKYRV